MKRHGLKLGFMSAFVKASAYGLTMQPTVNAVIEENEIVYRDFVDISVAVATPKVRERALGINIVIHMLLTDGKCSRVWSCLC